MEINRREFLSVGISFELKNCREMIFVVAGGSSRESLFITVEDDSVDEGEQTRRMCNLIAACSLGTSIERIDFGDEPLGIKILYADVCAC